MKKGENIPRAWLHSAGFRLTQVKAYKIQRKIKHAFIIPEHVEDIP